MARGRRRTMMITFAKTPLGGPTLPLPPFLSLPLHSATLSTTSSKGGGRMPKNHNEDDSRDAPNDDRDATHAVGWTAPLPFHLVRHHPHPPRHRRRGSLVTPFSSLHRLSPFDALIINEGGDCAGGHRTTMPAPAAPSPRFRQCPPISTPRCML